MGIAEEDQGRMTLERCLRDGRAILRRQGERAADIGTRRLLEMRTDHEERQATEGHETSEEGGEGQDAGADERGHEVRLRTD